MHMIYFRKRHNFYNFFARHSPGKIKKKSYMVQMLRYSSITYFKVAEFYDLSLLLWCKFFPSLHFIFRDACKDNQLLLAPPGRLYIANAKRSWFHFMYHATPSPPSLPNHPFFSRNVEFPKWLLWLFVPSLLVLLGAIFLAAFQSFQSWIRDANHYNMVKMDL